MLQENIKAVISDVIIERYNAPGTGQNAFVYIGYADDAVNNVITGGSFSLLNSLVDAPNITASIRHGPYVNNTALTTANTRTNTVTLSNASNYMFIGATSSLGTFFTGQIAEIIIHSRKISTSELGQLNTNINNYHNLY